MTTQVFVPSTPLNTAVLFLVFNRPDSTKKVFESIRQAKPPRLYVAADGIRVNRPGEAERVEQVRKIATKVDWPCEVKTLFRDENLGCKDAVSSAITWFFENEEQGIILEDDCLPSQSFFWYCEYYLNEYKENEYVGSISGNLRKFESLEMDYAISKSIYFNMWGWATWRRVWKFYDAEFFEKEDFSNYKNIFDKNNVSRYWSDIFKKMKKNKINTWDYQFMFLLFKRKCISIYPNINLVANLGFGVDATHCKDINNTSAYIREKEFNLNCFESELSRAPNIDGFLNNEYTKENIGHRLFVKLTREFRKLQFQK